MRDDEDFGLVVNLDFGTTAETTASDWNGDGDLNDSEESDSFEVREAFGVYKTPLELPGGKISLKGGKFVTLLGYEVLYNYNAFNFNVSKSILFGYSIPFTHTGLLAKFPFHDMVTLDIGVVNGWDNVKDTNDSKSLLAGLGIAPADMVTMYLATTYGAEQADSAAVRGLGIKPGHAKRFTLTGNVVVTPIDMLTLVVDATYANETDIVPDGGGGLDNALWYGGAFYVVVVPIEKLTLALRAEVFDDSDGVRLASANAATGSTTWEITPTVGYQLTDHVLARLEYRHDSSSKQIFDDGDGFNDTSDTFSGQLIFAF
jgi:opacity protein-like surface antigen